MTQESTDFLFSDHDSFRKFYSSALARLKEQNQEIEYLIARVEKIEHQRNGLKRTSTILFISLIFLVLVSLI